MPRKRKSGRRANVTGRSVGGDAHHARLYDWELKSAAYRSLSVGARALLVELKSLYFGNNNGGLFLSVRDAGQRLNVGKDRASKLFNELRGKGFIRPNEIGAFNMKALAGAGRATTWVLTEYPLGNATVGTKEFMSWRPPARPPQNHLAVPETRTPCPAGKDTSPKTKVKCPHSKDASADSEHQTVPLTGTQIDIPREAA